MNPQIVVIEDHNGSNFSLRTGSQYDPAVSEEFVPKGSLVERLKELFPEEFEDYA